MNHKSLQLRLYPDSVLRAKASPIRDFDDTTRALIEAMTAFMRTRGAIGLAAPQLGIAQRVFVAEIGDELLALANPSISDLESEALLREGCLSLPNIQVNVPRAQAILVRGLDARGKEIEREVSGLMSRVIQHEIDHLNGVLIIDHGPAIVAIDAKNNEVTT
jgi:peptide deformylase